MFSERSGVVNIGLEGMMLMGAFWGIWGADKTGSWVSGVLIAMVSGGLLALVHAFFAIHLRADQIVGGVAVNFLALGITGYFFVQLYHGENVPTGISQIPDVNLAKESAATAFWADSFGHLNLMIWLAILLVPLSYVVLFKTPIGLRIRACGEHPRAADTVGINVYVVRYGAVVLSGILAAMGGAYLSIGFLNTFNENVTAGRGFIALAALIFGNWRPFGAFCAALLFGFSTALAFRLPVYSDERGHALPGAAVHPHADRRRRRDRPHRPACRRWPALQEAVARAGVTTRRAARCVLALARARVLPVAGLRRRAEARQA